MLESVKSDRCQNDIKNRMCEVGASCQVCQLSKTQSSQFYNNSSPDICSALWVEIN